MNLSFREKSLWLDLIATLVIAFYYAFALSGFSGEQIADIHAVMDLLWDVVVFGILISIFSTIALSYHDSKAADAPLDERENLAELKATQYGYWVLLVGITAPVLLYGLESGGLNEMGLSLPPYATLHAMVAFYILAEILVSANQLWRLRQAL